MFEGVYFIMLASTLVSEAVIARLFNLRSLHQQAIVCLMNSATHVSFHFVLYLFRLVQRVPSLATYFLFEIGITFLEWIILRYVFPKISQKNLLAAVVSMNAVSFAIGEVAIAFL